MADATRTTFVLATLLALLLAPVHEVRAGAAEDAVDPSQDTAGEPAPVAVEIVRGSGVAEAYRREGADFPSYGPEGPARTLSPEAQALRALKSALAVQLAALGDTADGAAPCAGGADCIGGLAVLARAPMQTRERRGLADEVLGAWLAAPQPAEPATAPRLSHALSFASGGHAWDVLLGFPEGRYAVWRDGVRIAAGTAAQTPGRDQLDALLRLQP